MSESLENKFIGHGKGSSDRKTEIEIAQERARREVGPNTPVRIVNGSELYHPDPQCERMAKEMHYFENQGIGRLFGEIRGEENLYPCPHCDPKRFKTLPKKVPLDGR